MEEIHTEKIDLNDHEVQDRVTEMEAERGGSVVTQVLCRKMMQLESTVDYLIEVLIEAGVVKIVEESEEDND